MSNIADKIAALMSMGYLIREVKGYVAEGGANQFTCTTVALSDFMSRAELDRNPVLVGGLLTHITPPSGAAVDTLLVQRAQVTATKQTAMVNEGNGNLLLEKTIYTGVGHDLVGSRNFQESHVWPPDNTVLPTRLTKLNKNDENIYVNQEGSGAASASGVSYNLFYAIPPP
jgi:hypothetical protein